MGTVIPLALPHSAIEPLRDEVRTLLRNKFRIDCPPEAPSRDPWRWKLMEAVAEALQDPDRALPAYFAAWGAGRIGGRVASKPARVGAGGAHNVRGPAR